MRRTSIITVLLLVLLLIGLRMSLVRIGPDEVGVRTNNLGPQARGVVERDFGPGWHLSIPFMHTWNVFPARIRRVELTKDPRHRSELGEEALLVQSSDGDRVMIDLHIFYRIAPGTAHRVLQDSGSGDAHLATLRSLTKDRLRAIFGTLRTEEFYDPAMRYAKSRTALAELRSAVEKRFLQAVDIMIQDIEFEPKYEQKIKDKKLADQQGELAKAQARAAAERAKVGAIQLETTKQVQLIETTATADAARIQAEANKYAAERRGEADLYREQLQAKGALALAEAEAAVKQAKTQALGGRGGANLTALEAVSKLKIDSITFATPGNDWFDVRAMATRLGARP